MTDQPTAYVVMIGEYPKAVSAVLLDAQEAALEDETRYSTGNREFRWDEYRSGEWRLMARRTEKGARWGWTQRCVRTAPFLPATEA
ncbi:hypothetical protein ACWCXC_31530 [Streptomyces sp. NPDC001515]